MADESPVNARTGGLDGVIPLQIPGDSLRPKMVNLSEMKDILDHFGGQLSRMTVHNWLSSDQTIVAIFGVSFLPSVKR